MLFTLCVERSKLEGNGRGCWIRQPRVYPSLPFDALEDWSYFIRKKEGIVPSLGQCQLIYVMILMSCPFPIRAEAKALSCFILSQSELFSGNDFLFSVNPIFDFKFHFKIFPWNLPRPSQETVILFLFE